MQSPWFIIGAGSIGCLWASRFEKSSIPYRLLCKQNQREPLSRSGVSILQKNNLFHFYPPLSNIEIQDANQPIKKLLICTKAFQTQPAITDIANRLSKDATIIILQNGLGSYEWLQQKLPESTIYNAITTDGVHSSKKLHFTQAGVGETWLGQIQRQPRNTDIENLLQQCKKHDIHLQWDPDIRFRLWEKLAVNCAINGLTVIHNCQNGQLLNNDVALKTMQQLCNELDQLLAAQHINSSQGDCFKYAQQITKMTANNVSSMLQDYQQRRPGELEAIYGYACQQARKAHLELPELNHLYQQLKKKFNFA